MLPRMRLALPSLLAAAAVAVALPACDDMRTESGDFGVNIADFPRIASGTPYLALTGTKLCDPSPRCGPCDADPPTCSGVDLAISGADLVEGCYPVEADAPLTFTFTPEGCTPERVAESLTVEAVNPDEARASFAPTLTLAEDVDQDTREIASQGDPLPVQSSLFPLQLLADRSVALGIRLYRIATDEVIGWNPSAGVLGLQAITGAAPTLGGDLGELTLSIAAGAESSATLSIAGVDFPLADVVGVDAAAIDRIELTALLLDGGADGQQPAQIEAHVKDADGKLIFGAPIEWRVLEGDLVLNLGEEGDPTDAVGLAECIPRRPESTRRGVVEAVSGEHRATLEITWKGYSGDEPYNAGPCAADGCGCRSGDAPAPLGLGLALLGLALGRRRRGRQ